MLKLWEWIKIRDGETAEKRNHNVNSNEFLGKDQRSINQSKQSRLKSNELESDCVSSA